MRQISPKAISIFSIFSTINILISIALGFFLFKVVDTSLQALYFIVPGAFYLTTIVSYRLFFNIFGFPQHQVPKNSADDFAFQIYLLYYLIYFNFFVHNSFLPVPIARGFHQLLGAKFGSGSYSAGFILDPPYVEIGENSIIGFNAVLCSHALEGENVSFEKIIIGNNVTIGLSSMIMPGVRIEDHAIVAAVALVTKNTHIKQGEIWAGIPAKRIKKGQEEKIPSIASYAS